MKSVPNEVSAPVHDSRIYDHRDYWFPMQQDVRAAVGSVKIHVPYVTHQMLTQWEPTLIGLQKRGITVCLALQLPRELQKDWRGPKTGATEAKRNELEALIAWLQRTGVHVELRDRIHAKLLVVDEILLWEGSLNFLSHLDTSEHLRRTISRADVENVTQRHLLRSCPTCHVSLPKPNMMFQKLMKERREKCELSQIELALILDTTQSKLSRLESGNTVILNPTFERLLQMIGLRILLVPDHLFGRTTKFIEQLQNQRPK